MSLFKRFFSWRVWRVIIFGTVALITLATLVIAFENWRGKRAWLRFKADAERRGERLDLASFIPAAVPPAENFAMTPLLAPLLDYTRAPHNLWRDTNALAYAQSISVSGGDKRELPRFGNRDKNQRTDLRAWQEYYRSSTSLSIAKPGDSPGNDILQALSKYDAVFAELHEAAKRPHAVFPVHYDETISALLPHLAVLKNLAAVLRLRVLAALDAGQGERATEDVLLMLRFADAIKQEPLLISQLNRVAIIQIAGDTVWEGLATGRWNDAQVARIQAAFAGIDLLADYDRAMAGERGFGNAFMNDRQMMIAAEAWSRFVPSGVLYQNQLTINRMYEKYCFGVIDAEKRRIDIDKAMAAVNPPELQRRHPYRFLAALLLPALEKSASRFAIAQTAVDEATLACALERHRLARGKYPAKLEDLKAQFTRAIPHDIITGEPLRYSASDGNSFVLYSVGWDRKDDHGRPAIKRMEDGDWVWRPALE